MTPAEVTREMVEDSGVGPHLFSDAVNTYEKHRKPCVWTRSKNKEHTERNLWNPGCAPQRLFCEGEIETYCQFCGAMVGRLADEIFTDCSSTAKAEEVNG